MLAADLIDLVGSSLEALPDLVFLFLRHRTYFLPFVVQLLEFLEGLAERFLIQQLFGFLAKLDLGIEIFLHVQITQFAANLYFVKELLDKEMIAAPKVGAF